jgi:hypothetical protein
MVVSHWPGIPINKLLRFPGSSTRGCIAAWVTSEHTEAENFVHFPVMEKRRRLPWLLWGAQTSDKRVLECLFCYFFFLVGYEWFWHSKWLGVSPLLTCPKAPICAEPRSGYKYRICIVHIPTYIYNTYSWLYNLSQCIVLLRAYRYVYTHVYPYIPIYTYLVYVCIYMHMFMHSLHPSTLQYIPLHSMMFPWHKSDNRTSSIIMRLW